MEHSWSRAVAASGTQWQNAPPRNPLKQAKTVAVGCDWLPIGAHGKEGVDGSSPSEGFAKNPCQSASCVAHLGVQSRGEGTLRILHGLLLSREGVDRLLRPCAWDRSEQSGGA